jgi:serine/threonine protein kinase/tetratricopeptide (TPR) repeat protein
MSERQDGDLDRATEIFERALALQGDERKSYLIDACTGNAKLRIEIQSLLAARSLQGEFLDKPTVGVEPAAPGAQAEGPGSVIDRYKLLQRIGEGGFGVVYMAEQREPIKRTVALKVIKLGMDTRQVIARFDAERQALAMMDHPGIARVLDAGSTEAGRPYFVMELVKGVPITEYCDTENCTTGERLDLFGDVCNAVQHAHQKGIIHRDLKPSNVLVTLHDGKPVPKVIDFGIAKATNAELTEKTLFTEFRQMVGTPAYMSPEQAEMSGLDLDTRSDIYSLGVLLYELLTGNTPFDARRLRDAGLGEIQRIIREESPARPSEMVSSLPESAGSPAAAPGNERTSAGYVVRHRQTDLQTLVRRLRGDLDWIVMRALEKDRTRRYGTAADFAADIRRHRTNQPVIARPPSTGYRMRTFMRRNRWGVSAAAVIALALVTGLTLATVGLVLARRAQAEVTEEAQGTRAVADFYAGVFSSVNPMRAAPGAPPAAEVTLVDVLHAAGERAETAFEGQPLLEAEVRKTLGASFFGLGSMDQAAAQAERALALETEALGPEHPTTLQTALQLGAAYWISGNYRDAERVIGPNIERAEAVIGANDPVVLRSMCLQTNTLANLGRLELAYTLARDVADRARTVLGENDPIAVSAQVDLARVMIDRGRLVESEALLRELVQRIQAGEVQPDPMTMLFAHGKLAMVLGERGEFEEAEALLNKTIAMSTRILGEEHPWAIAIETSRGSLLHARGDLEQAERHLERILGIIRASAGREAHQTLSTTLQLLPVLIERGRIAEAEQLGREVSELTMSESWALLGNMYVGWALLERGEATEAERVVGAVLKDLEERYPGGFIGLPTCRRIYGRILTALGRFEEAESQLRRAYEAQREMSGPANRATRSGAVALRDLYRAWGKPDAANEWEIVSQPG